jgi:hypothetical protein
VYAERLHVKALEAALTQHQDAMKRRHCHVWGQIDAAVRGEETDRGAEIRERIVKGFSQEDLMAIAPTVKKMIWQEGV